MPPDQPTIDDMRLALQRQAQETIQPTPQSEFEKAVGSLGGYIDAAGRFVRSATEPIAQSHPIRSWLAQNLIAAPLRNVGTAMQDWTGTERDITPKDPRYTPGPFYGGSSMTLNPQTWGPAMQTFRTDPRALDVAAVAPIAASAARKAAAPVARAAGEALNARLLAGESLVPGLPASVAPNPLAFAVKPKGGNWLPNEVESALQSIRPSGPGGSDAQTALRDFDAAYPQKNLQPEMLDLRNQLVRDSAMSNWVDKKLTGYIKNELATPEDPLRELADKGVSHINNLGAAWLDQPHWGVSQSQRRKRIAAGMPEEGYAKTRAGKDWEARSDFSVTPNSLKEYALYNELLSPRLRADLSDLEKALEKNPEAKVNELYGNAAQYLEFDHLVDELRNAIDPSSNLPNNLRLTPEKLQKVTVPQAVELVSKINDWRALEAAKAEKAGMLENLKAASRLDIPDVQLSFVKEPGMHWSDLADAKTKEGMKLCNTIGRQAGWCTESKEAALRYGSGENRLAVMMDADGRPHVQAMISPPLRNNVPMYGSNDWSNLLHANMEEILAHRGFNVSDEISDAIWYDEAHKLPKEIRDTLHEVEKKAEKIIEMSRREKAPENPPDIAELKPVGNNFESDRAKEYARRDPQYEEKITDSVLKFLNSREWGTVDDLHHYDIVDRKNTTSIQTALKEIFRRGVDFNKNFYEMSDEIYNNTSAPRFINFSQMRDIVKSSEPKTYAQGGIVRLAKDQDAMRYELMRNK